MLFAIDIVLKALGKACIKIVREIGLLNLVMATGLEGKLKPNKLCLKINLVVGQYICSVCVCVCLSVCLSVFVCRITE